MRRPRASRVPNRTVALSALSHDLIRRTRSATALDPPAGGAAGSSAGALIAAATNGRQTSARADGIGISTRAIGKSPASLRNPRRSGSPMISDGSTTRSMLICSLSAECDPPTPDPSLRTRRDSC